MAITIVLTIVLGFSNLLWYVNSETTTPDNGDLIFEIKEPESEKYMIFYNSFKKTGPDMATFFNAQFNFPKNLYFVIEECDNPNPAYYNGIQTVKICYLFLDESRNFAKEYESQIGKKGYLELLNGLFVFVFVHEIAHGLIDILDLPVVGNEEIAADQLATLILLESIIQEPESEFVLAGPMQFFAEDTKNYLDIDSIPFWHKHPLGEQRSVDILCLAYGKFGEEPFPPGLLQHIDSSRLSKCHIEFYQISHNWVELIHEHLKPGSALQEITVKYPLTPSENLFS